MEELTAEERQQLEERLYSSVHHSLVHHTFSPHTFSPPEHENNQPKNVNTDKNSNTSKFLAKRYWTNKTDETTSVNINERPNKANQHVQKSPQPSTSSSISTAAHNIPRNSKNDKKQNNNKIRNPFANKNPFGKHTNAKGNHPHQQQNKNFHNGQTGPFVQKSQKLERVNQWNNKKQKAKNAHEKMLANTKVVANISLDSDDNEDDDEVIVVPLPPTPVFSIDDSDEDMAIEETNIKKEINIKNKFASPQTKHNIVPILPATENSVDNTSRCTSPCTCSVMSHDDFMSQNDRHRLLDNSNVITNDADLVILNSNTDSLLEPPTPPPTLNQNKTLEDIQRKSDEDIECVGTFIKPTYSIGNSKKNNDAKENYRVGETEFRAMDVYESESDIVSDGVYSKGVGKSSSSLPNTTIRNLEESSTEEMDISQNPVKTKRLRKRRASGTFRNSESNGADSTATESDENDGVESTGIPFIARGPAVENYKSKKKRKQTISTGRMSDSEFVATLNSLAQGEPKDDESIDESENEENKKVPTARELAESALKPKKTIEKTTTTINDDEQPSTSKASRKRKTMDDAVPLEIANDIENLFKKINDFDVKKATEISDEEYAELAEGSPTTAAAQNLNEGNDVENSIKYYIGYTPANNKCISDGFGWNEEMQRFYNDSWGGEMFHEEYIWKSMPRHPSIWRISDADRSPNIFAKGKRDKCMNCRTFGHAKKNCPLPKRPVVCYMCGQSGHSEARCPDTRCLRCGQKSTVFTQSCKKCMFSNNRICPICKLRGHSLNDCPDKWRRYHSTTQPNVYPNSKVLYNKRRFCSFCGRRGHLSDECREGFYKTEYPLISTEIKSHEKSYDDVLISSHRSPGIACRLLFDPNLYVNFTMSEKAKRYQVYGRFLSAVGLERLIGKSKKTQQRAINTKTITGENTSPAKVPAQVLEITEGEENVTTTTNKPQETETAEQEESASLQMPPPPHLKPADPTLPIDTADSDSNYSFSDHFELPSTPSAGKQNPTITQPLPDFIPLGGGNRFKEKPMEETVIEITDSPASSVKSIISISDSSPALSGISARFVASNSDDEQEINSNPNVNLDKPCEAKIYISDEHHKYFQTEIGEKYLKNIMSENKLTGQLNTTIVGFALFLNGLPADQEKLQRQLELKFKELNTTKISSSSQTITVPKNIAALKRMLQAGIKQLITTNLGSASNLYKQMNEMEKKATKNSLKSAERIRRTLNMIFLGQAGLNHGDKYFQTLLSGLEELTKLETEKAMEKVPFVMRKHLDESYRMIFTSYNHKNYATLMLSYLNISPPNMRNRLHGLEIDGKLLGNAVVNVILTKEQKERMNDSTKYDLQVKQEEESKIKNTNDIEENATLLLNVIVPEKIGKTTTIISNNDSNKINKTNKNSNEQTNVNEKEIEKEKETTNFDKQNKSNEETVEEAAKTISDNQNKVATTTPTPQQSLINNLNDDNIDKTKNSTPCPLDNSICQNLLMAIEVEKADDTACKVNASKISSEFWSRESKKFLEELIDLASVTNSSKNLEHLNCIYKNANEHKLSYNDYNCIVKLHKKATK